MSTVTAAVAPVASDAPMLENGARMSRIEFHRLYEQTADDFRAELIGGVVYMPSPLRRSHGVYHVLMTTLFGVYVAQTPGTEAGDNASLLLGAESEPQPDLYLRIRPEFGGQSATSPDDYVEGAPELLVEIALSSRSPDLHAKRTDYHRNGVLEYLVLVPRQKELVWFDLASDRQISSPTDRIVRPVQFPGLWLSVDAILDENQQLALDVLHQGLATSEHQQFVQSLAQRRRH